MTGKRASFLLLTAFLLVSPAGSQEWPQWRGPNRDGVPTHPPSVRDWPERLTRVWEVPVGTGHSSPVVGDQRIVVHTRQGEDEAVSCYALETGKILWSRRYSAAYEMNGAAIRHGKGPKSTPLLSRGKIYSLGITGILSCFDFQTGTLSWRRDFSGHFPSTSPLYGTAMSPIMDGSLLIAHVGGNDDGSLLGLDAATGETRWSWKGDGPGYASPVIAEIAGVRHVITQSQKHVIGVSATTGELLWGLPFSTPYIQNIITPILYNDSVIFSGLDQGVTAVRVAKTSRGWSAEKVWENREASFYMSTPVIHGDHLYGMSHRNRGQFVCLDARTGASIWAGEARQGENAAVVVAADRLFFLTNDASLIVARATPRGFEIIRRYTVAGSPTWAHPVLLRNGLLIKDESNLSFWRWE